MSKIPRLRVAIQKSGRLAEKSTQLFTKCGLDFDLRKDRLLHHSVDFPVDLMLVRDDDIPGYVADGVCDLGIVGENVLKEKYWSRPENNNDKIIKIMDLNFGSCRLSIAAAESFDYKGAKSLNGLTIATSYPNCLADFLRKNQITAKIVELGGSVEIAPALNIADAICDLVSSGSTLRSNGLKEVEKLFDSQACFVRSGENWTPQKTVLLARLTQRIQGVLTAGHSKYIMMNAPKSSVPKIFEILPGMEEPSVIPLGVDSDRVAIHAVAREDVFWETIEKLKSQGANSILVLPIEKVII